MHVLLVLALTVGAFATLSAFDTEEAEAGITLGFDLDFGAPLGEENFKDNGIGTGFTGRLGYSLPIPLISLAIESSFSYIVFPDGGAASPETTIWAFRAGGRLGLPLPILPFFTPSFYGHVGTGNASFGNFSDGGLAWDVGGALDFTLLPIISVGAHLGYAVQQVALQTALGSADGELQWFNFGVHAQLEF